MERPTGTWNVDYLFDEDLRRDQTQQSAGTEKGFYRSEEPNGNGVNYLFYSEEGRRTDGKEKRR